MLRRLPTALAISPEDITAYEEQLTHRLAYMQYRKTGEDPEGRFTNNPSGGIQKMKKEDNGKVNNKSGGGVVVDPNDELKPLPGDKARIVRSREERIMGGGR